MNTTSLLDVARSSRWLIVLAAVAGGAAGYLFGQFGNTGATASVPVAVSDDAINQAGGEGYAVDELRQVVVAMVESTATAQEVAAVTGVRASALDIRAESDTRSPVVTVVVSASTADDALAAAGAVPAIVAEERQRLFAEHHRSSLDSEPLEDAAGNSVRTLDEPSLRRSSPAPPVIAVLGALAGASAVFGLAVLLADRRRERAPWRSGVVRTAESWELNESEEPTGLLLAEHGSAVPAVPEESSEAYEWILDRLLAPSMAVLGVVGADTEDGTGLTAAALAFAHAGRGRTVALFSLGIPPSASSADELTDGLRSVVDDRAALTDALIELESPGAMFYLPPGNISTDWLLPRCDHVRNQIELARRSGISLVILELPPALSVDDPRPLLDLADGVVISTVRRATDPESLAATRRWIRRSNSTLLGEVSHHDQLSRPLFARRPVVAVVEPATTNVA